MHLRMQATPVLALLALLALSTALTTWEDEADFRILPRDAETRGLCEMVAQRWTSPFAQYEQDTFVWHNFLIQRGNNGTYVDVGAYDPHEMSNTAFLDICLGWQGVCIEANPERRAQFALRHPKRTCTFVDSCVADGNFDMDLILTGAGPAEPFGSRMEERASAAPRSGVQPVRCRPLASILRDVEITHVNFLSMDIEGMELRALAVYPFKEIPIDVILVESIAPYQWALNYLMTMQGFRLEQQLAIDTLYVHRSWPSRPAGQPLVYPAQWDEVWRQQAHFRCSHAEDVAPCSPSDREFLPRVGRVGMRAGVVEDPAPPPEEGGGWCLEVWNVEPLLTVAQVEYGMWNLSSPLFIFIYSTDIISQSASLSLRFTMTHHGEPGAPTRP